MDNRAEVREFLMSRRAKVAPAQVGLPAGQTRRVLGLRRTEVAMLAGVSVEYYAKLERGAIAGASSAVLDAIAQALQLDNTERAHLFDLARAADGIPTSGRLRRRATKQIASRPSLHWALAAITDGIAFVRNPQQDLLATNALGRIGVFPI
jgi:transcriptional regulator with XRE-family HTH domain